MPDSKMIKVSISTPRKSSKTFSSSRVRAREYKDARIIWMRIAKKQKPRMSWEQHKRKRKLKSTKIEGTTHPEILMKTKLLTGCCTPKNQRRRSM